MLHLSEHLSLLENRGLVRVALERGTSQVRFKHALTRQASYNSMLQVRRAELHRAAAETLTALYPQPDLEMVLTIADHWQRGSEDGAALQTVLPHAQRLIYTGRSTSLTALLEHLQRENLLETQQRDLDIGLADAYQVRGEFESARDLYERALPFADDPALRARIIHRIGVANYNLGKYEQSIQQHKQAFDLALDLGHLVLQAQTLGGLGSTALAMGDVEIAQRYYEQSRDASQASGQVIEQTNAEFNLALILAQRGEFRQAITFAERVLSTEQSLGFTMLAARTHQLLGSSYYGLGENEEAERHYLFAIESSGNQGDVLGMAVGLSNLAELYDERGELERAADAYRRAIPYLESIKHYYSLAFDLTGLAQVEWHQAKHLSDTARDNALRMAQAHAEHALEIATAMQSRERMGAAFRVLGQIAASAGNYAQARNHATRAVELLTEPSPEIERRRAVETLHLILADSPDAAERAQAQTFFAQRETGGN